MIEGEIPSATYPTHPECYMFRTGRYVVVANTTMCALHINVAEANAYIHAKGLKLVEPKIVVGIPKYIVMYEHDTILVEEVSVGDYKHVSHSTTTQCQIKHAIKKRRATSVL